MTEHPDSSHDHAHDDHHGPAHLAHHFDTPEQQEESGKLGMWIFLVTEIMMFGGLFCAYALYRANHFEIFEYCHWMLDWKLGTVNTAVLLASSLTMAIGVRAAQLGQKKVLIVMLALTLLGGFGFMGIKAIEYSSKWSHELWPGQANAYYPLKKQIEEVTEINAQRTKEAEEAGTKPDLLPVPTEESRLAQIKYIENYYFYKTLHAEWYTPQYIDPKFVHVHDGHAEIKPPMETEEPAGEHGDEHHGYSPQDAFSTKTAYGPAEPPATQPYAFPTAYQASTQPSQAASEPNLAGKPAPVVGAVPKTSSSIPKPAAGPTGLNVALVTPDPAPHLDHHGRVHYTYETLPVSERERVHLFFQIYYMMTGLHGIHVLVGMGLIAWIGWRAIKGHFSPEYYAPVDIVGLYWHLVDLIWIFLFPLLYLIH